MGVCNSTVDTVYDHQYEDRTDTAPVREIVETDTAPAREIVATDTTPVREIVTTVPGEANTVEGPKEGASLDIVVRFSDGRKDVTRSVKQQDTAISLVANLHKEPPEGKQIAPPSLCKLTNHGKELHDFKAIGEHATLDLTFSPPLTITIDNIPFTVWDSSESIETMAHSHVGFREAMRERVPQWVLLRGNHLGLATTPTAIVFSKTIAENGINDGSAIITLHGHLVKKDSFACFQEVFNRFDLNDDGTVNSEEQMRLIVRHLCDSFEVPATQDKIETSMQALWGADSWLPNPESMRLGQFIVWFEANFGEIDVTKPKVTKVDQVKPGAILPADYFGQSTNIDTALNADVLIEAPSREVSCSDRSPPTVRAIGPTVALFLGVSSHVCVRSV